MNRSHEHSEVLLRKAHGDAKMLYSLNADPEMPDWGMGFHAQQAVEKAIKAVLANHSVEYPYTHDLLVLLKILRENKIQVPPDAEQLPVLTPFGAPLRYDGASDADEQGLELDRSWLESCVKRTLEWAESTIDG
ncbi:MAG: HEPN domain-containing protein [Phycisphaerae bacterium]|nr:HEPN domain-containing protein [Phycisphaerae bacterium]